MVQKTRTSPTELAQPRPIQSCLGEKVGDMLELIILEKNRISRQEF